MAGGFVLPGKVDTGFDKEENPKWSSEFYVQDFCRVCTIPSASSQCLYHDIPQALFPYSNYGSPCDLVLCLTKLRQANLLNLQHKTHRIPCQAMFGVFLSRHSALLK